MFEMTTVISQNKTQSVRYSQLAVYLLLPLLFPLVLSVLQHLFFPQVKEVGGVGVELKCFLVVIPAETNTRMV